MIIYGKTIVFNLIVSDQETEEIVFSDYFGSLEELNRFLANPTIKEPLLPEIEIDICTVENDSEIILNFTYELSCLDEMDEDEIGEITEGFEDFINPQRVQLTPELIQEETDEKESNESSLSAFKYLCPNCWNEVEQCSCLGYPYYLIQIDVGLAEIVKTLNLKGYQTTSTCEGHFNKGSKSILIVFKEQYKFDLPEGFYGDGWEIKSKYISTTEEDFQKEKECKLQKLGNYVQTLPNLY